MREVDRSLRENFQVNDNKQEWKPQSKKSMWNFDLTYMRCITNQYECYGHLNRTSVNIFGEFEQVVTGSYPIEIELT